MTADAVPAAIVPLRPAWRSLLWTVPFTVLWTWLIYSLPVLPESGLPALAVRLMVHGLVALGLWLGLERTDLTAGQRRTAWLAIMVPFTLWAAVAWTAAIDGVFRTGASALPLLPSAIFLPLMIGAPLLLLSKRVGQLLDAMPTTWLVALQLYRVFGSQWLAYWLRGLLPVLWALPAGTGDVLTGLFAVPVAIALATGNSDPLEHLRHRGPRRRDHLGNDHLARPVPADRSEWPEHRPGRLSQCADPCVRGARLDPAARAVAAPTAPAPPGRGDAPLDARSSWADHDPPHELFYPTELSDGLRICAHRHGYLRKRALARLTPSGWSGSACLRPR